MKFINKIQKFMYGRYGMDELTNFMFYLYLITLILSLFSKYKFLLYIEIVLFILIILRTTSKKIYKRSRENQKFIKIKNKILKPFKNIKRNIKDKNNVYKKCPKCKRVLKLKVPMKNGKKHITCPDCGKRFTTFVLKKQKIEVIKK